jgi:hypothetical protein
MKVARDEGMIAGIGKKLREGDEIVVLGVRYTPQTLAAEYQRHLEQMQDVTQREIAWHTAVYQENALETRLRDLTEHVRLYLVGRFGPSSPVLRAFGLKPRKKAVTSVATKKLAIEKRLETRRLRRTMGKKQRKRIKGTI